MGGKPTVVLIWNREGLEGAEIGPDRKRNTWWRAMQQDKKKLII